MKAALGPGWQLHMLKVLILAEVIKLLSKVSVSTVVPVPHSMRHFLLCVDGIKTLFYSILSEYNIFDTRMYSRD